MGVWNSSSTVVTDAGMKLLSAIAGKKALTLSRAVAGSDFTTKTELEAMTDISHQKMNMNFSDFGRDDNGTAYVDIYLDNSSVDEEFYHQQIGIYAKDTSDNDVLFLVAQADSPDYIPEKSVPVFITHRIFLKFSGSSKVQIDVGFSGIVTQEGMNLALKKKENAFDKNNAFNKNFSDSGDDYFALGTIGYPGSSESVARADHVHPVGTILKYAENNWNKSEKTNLVPDTNRWVMSNGKSPLTWGEYSFEANFTQAWEGFSCFFDADQLANVKGKTVELGLDHLTGASSRLELIVDDALVKFITETESAASLTYEIPNTAKSVTVRIIIFSSDDLHCEFTGLYMYDVEEAEKANDDGNTIFLSVRKVLQSRLPKTAVSGTVYLTEKGNIYLTLDDGTLMPLAGSDAI